MSYPIKYCGLSIINQNKINMKNLLLSIGLAFTLTMNAQTNSINLRSAKQVLPLLMNDLSNESSYNNGIVKLGYHTTGKNSAGGTIYTNSDNDWIIYNTPVKAKNEWGSPVVKFSLIYYSRETDNLDSVLSYLDGYYNSELYNGYGLEVDDSSHEMNLYFSKHKSGILQFLKIGELNYLDKAKYYIKDRGDKNTLWRGIKLVNKSENGVEKPYYTAFVYIEEEISDNASQVSQASQESLSEEYTESEFQGASEVELDFPLMTTEKLVDSKWQEDGNHRHWKFFSNHTASLNGSKPTYKWNLSKDYMLKVSNNGKIILNAKIFVSNGSMFSMKDKNGKITEMYPY